jgi:hypothetical protein
MADHQDVIDAGNAFASALYDLSQNGEFSQQEQGDFGLLFTMYQGALAQFTLGPAFGPDSPQYDRARDDANEGTGACARATSGDNASQQPVFDHAHKGAASLRAVTAPVPHLAGG